jgi:hypothetical protein
MRWNPLVIGILASLGLGLLFSTVPVLAVPCAIDDVPAATLLLPYFEIDLENPGGQTTLFSVANAAAESHLAIVTLWTDLGVPSLSFHLYLTGYDVVTVNLRDVLAEGIIPQTGSDLVPAGDYSLANETFPGCENFLPLGNLPQIFRDHVRNFHTGDPSPIFGNQCGGLRRGDGIARGYVTIDVARRCAALLPNQEGFFGADGVLGFDNVLWGEYFQIDPSEDFAHGETLVRIEAVPDRFAADDLTFYRRIAGDTSDAREPLPAVWMTRFMVGGAFNGGTKVIAWRGGDRDATPFDCSQIVSWFLEEGQMVEFDEDENPVELDFQYFCAPIFSDPDPFVLATQTVTVGSPNLPTFFDFGWLYLSLAAPGRAPGVEIDPFAQAWVGTISEASGRFSVGYRGTPLGDACSREVPILRRPEVP